MLPEEFEGRAANQTPEQRAERLKWEGFCAVINDRLKPVKPFEVRIDGWGNNRLHVGSTCLNQELRPGEKFFEIFGRWVESNLT